MMQFKNLQIAVIIWRERQQPRTEDNKALNRSCRPPFLTKQVNLRQHRLTPSLASRDIMRISPLIHFVFAGLLLIVFEWQQQCHQWIEGARDLAKNDIGILVTYSPQWIPRRFSKLAVFRRPGLAEIYVSISRDGDIEIQGESLDIKSAQQRLLDLRAQIFKDAGTNNVHIQFAAADCTVEELMASDGGRKTESKLHDFALENKFSSTGLLNASAVAAR